MTPNLRSRYVVSTTLTMLLLAAFMPTLADDENGSTDQQPPQNGRLGGGGGGAGGGRFQSLSVDQKRALLQRFRQKRMQQSQGSAANNSPPANLDAVSIKNDIPYGKDPLQQLDLYTPKERAKTPLPIVIFVHGGGWTRGDKNQGDRKTKGCVYVDQGIIFVSANYRLAPKVVHPKQVQDIAAAFAWVKQHASEFGGDPNRIFIMGHSAGAHLVDLLGTNGKYLAEVGLGLKDISGVISLDTASLDLTERRKDDGPETVLVGPMIDSAFGTNPAVLKDASPTLNIHSGTSYPPFMMFCGSKRLNCVQQHKKFADAMKSAGGTVTVRAVPLSHGDINRASGQPGSEVYKGCMELIKGSR